MKVSVIIPAFNAKRTIKKALNSVLRQTYPNTEIIIVNDCSTDNTSEICQKISEQYKTKDIRIINKEKNEGVDFARHTGIANAKGDYILFLDADDWYEKNSIESLVKTIEKQNVDIVYANKRLVYSAKLGIKKKLYIPSSLMNRVIKDEEKEEYKISFFGSKKLIPVSIYNVLLRKNLFTESIEKTGLKFGEDAFLAMQLYNNAKTIFILPSFLYNYRWGGFTSQIKPEIIQECRKGYILRKEWCLKNGYEEGIDASLRDFLFCFIGFCKTLKVCNPKGKEENIRIIEEEMKHPIYRDFLKLSSLPGPYQKELPQAVINLQAELVYNLLEREMKQSLKSSIKRKIKQLLSKIYRKISL